MNKKGSYSLDDIENKHSELTRLQTQAQLMSALEMKLLKESGIQAHHNVLEYGCGPGFVTPLLCELANQGKVIGLDNDENLLQLCKQKINKHPLNGFLTVHSSEHQVIKSLESQIDFCYLRFVLQHVTNKVEVLEQIYSLLKPNGIICTVDSDDGIIIQFPEDEFIQSIIMEAQKKQETKGGDRKIGRKIPIMLSEAKFVNIKSRVINFTCDDIPFAALAKILFGFKSELIGKSYELEKWIKEKESLINTKKYFLTGGIILTTAQKIENQHE